MKRRTTLPLGVDAGTARTRVALVERDVERNAASRRGRDARHAATIPRRRSPKRAPSWVLASVAASSRSVRRTPSSARRRFRRCGVRERERAARFEAMRYIGYPIADAALRVTPLDDSRCVVAVARRARLEQRVAEARRAGLRPLAVDDVTFALMRAFPYADAVVDVGERASILAIRREPIPSVRTFAIGGGAFTDAVVSSLGVDRVSAERRKCGIGLAGAGETTRNELVEQIASALVDHRAAAGAELRAIALCGNGARIAGLADALERASAIPVRLAALPPDSSDTLPADVVRAASPDWGLAYGLALWENAA